MANKSLTPRLNRMEPNIVIDGGMEIWPEGTSRVATSGTQQYGAAMVRLANVTSSVSLTNSQQASIPSGTNIPFSNQVSKTAAGTLAAATNINLSYFIEGYDVNKILNKDFSLIFWVKSSVASNRSVSLLNSSLSHSLVQQYNIASANTWELKVLHYQGISACPGTIERTTSAGLQIAFAMVAGSTFQTATLGSWQAGNFRAGLGEDTTWLTGTTHDFNIAGVMILPGDWTSLTASTYEFQRSERNFPLELNKTLRFFQKSYNSNVNPGTITDVGAHREQSGPNGVWRKAIPTKVPMRASPTVVFYNNATGASNSVRVGASNFTPGAAGFGENTVSFEVGGVGVNSDAFVHWTFDARF